MTSLADWLSYIESLHPKSWDLGLTRVQSVAENLKILPSGTVFLVAGTNGKGSTCEYIDRLCRTRGLVVGKSTSPHLVRFNERIQIDGQPASDQEIVTAFQTIEHARKDISLTYFEFAVLASLLIFKERGVDVLVLEIGMGGRLDAMNIVTPDVSVITQVALDHQEWLGHSREEIAAEKACIMRPGTHCVIADRDPPGTLTAHAEQVGAKVHLLGVDFDFNDAQFFAADTQLGDLAAPKLPRDSAAAAIQAVICAGIMPDRDAVHEVLSQTLLPGRRQWLTPRLLLDVAHNPAAVSYLKTYVDTLPASTVRAVVGMYRDKEFSEVLRIMSSSVDHWYFTDLPLERAADAAALAEAIGSIDHSGDVTTYDKVDSALNNAMRHSTIEDLIVVFGSFPVVAGAILSVSVMSLSKA
ncbi:MAG: bifunctional tetrahydrofolate synthase/dihydrofolate synthase [Pseudomonadales bacterium]|nr:bifunctional tetrahydrofolate synthase/dihydrofolate synthase [Pseudomonadales bacterium]